MAHIQKGNLIIRETIYCFLTSFPLTTNKVLLPSNAVPNIFEAAEKGSIIFIVLTK